MALFRRTKSPRSVEFRTTAGLGNGDKPSQQSEENKREKKKGGKSFSAHRRHKSDELNSILESTEVVETPTFLSQSEEVVDVYQLSDPGFPPLPPHLPPRHRGGSGGTSTLNFSRSSRGWRRTQSGGTTMTSSQQPPHQEYFVPADTLKTVHQGQRSSMYPANGSAVGPGGPPVSHHGPGHHMHGGHSSSKDKRNIEMHNKIVAQNDPLQMSIKRKSRSLENLVECSDYSLPFDVVSEGHSQTSGHKSRSPENQLQVTSQNQKTHSDSNLHNTSTPPAKPARKTRDYNPPSFAPPPPPQGDDPSISPDGIHTRPKTDDYEEPWNSSKFLPRQNRRNRADTDFSRSGSHQQHSQDHLLHKPSPRSHRSHTMHHENSPPDTEPNAPSLPPRPPITNSPRLRTESAEVTPSSPQFDVHRNRATTGESSDYCIPPDAILHDINGLSINNGTTGQSGGGFGEECAYVNQPPIPPPPAHRTSTTTATTTDTKKKLRYPPLLPSEYYITDIQNLPPPAFAINTSLPLEEQPWFHGRISRDQAEDILFNQPDFSFLLRKSESSRMDYSLSIRDSTSPAAQGFIHLKITQEKGGYVLGQFSAPFATVPQCISYYTQRELTIKHINHRRLGFPVGRMSNSPIQ